MLFSITQLEVAMKRILVFVLSALMLAACTAQLSATFVPLPDTERVAITALVVAALGWVFAFIVAKLPWASPIVDKYKMEISLALAGVVIGVIENALPSAYPEISILFIQLVLAVLAAVGVFGMLHKAGAPGFRA
jgi:hypothetical protein